MFFMAAWILPATAPVRLGVPRITAVITEPSDPSLGDPSVPVGSKAMSMRSPVCTLLIAMVIVRGSRIQNEVDVRTDVGVRPQRIIHAAEEHRSLINLGAIHENASEDAVAARGRSVGRIDPLPGETDDQRSRGCALAMPIAQGVSLADDQRRGDDLPDGGGLGGSAGGGNNV